MGKQCRHYDKELKLEAVRMVVTQGDGQGRILEAGEPGAWLTATGSCRGFLVV